MLTFVLLFLVACGSNNSSTETTDSSGSSESGNDTGETFTLISSIQAPQTADLSKGFDAYLDTVEELSNGRIEFERYYGETLVKAPDHLDAVSSGIADIALLVPSYTPGQNPLASIESLPALWENQWAGTRAYMDLYKEYSEFREEFENLNVQVVGHWALPSYYVIGNDNIASIDDLQGKSLITAGGLSLLADEIGANSVGIVITEAFEAMEKGTVDGAMLGLTGSSTYGIHEVAESLWLLPVGSQAGIFGLNKDVYESLPDDLKLVFDEAALQNSIDFHIIYQDNAEKAALEKYEEAGVTINEATEEQVSELRDIVSETIWNRWKKDSSRSNYDTDAILDRFIELIDQYEEEFQNNGLPE